MENTTSPNNLNAMIKDYVSLINSAEGQNLMDQVRKDKHPSGEMIYDYVLGDLEEGVMQFISQHLLLCPQCAEEELRIRRIEMETGQAALDWANEI